MDSRPYSREPVLIYKVASDFGAQFYTLLSVYTRDVWLLTIAITFLAVLVLAVNSILFASRKEVAKSHWQHIVRPRLPFLTASSINVALPDFVLLANRPHGHGSVVPRASHLRTGIRFPAASLSFIVNW